MENEEEVVSFGDIIWLQHIEKDNYLFFDNKKDISHFLQEGMKALVWLITVLHRSSIKPL